MDFQKTVAKADLRFDGPAKQPEHGLPIGNGTTGSMVWTSPSSLHFQINRVDVYASDSSSMSFPVRHEDYCGGCAQVEIELPAPAVFTQDATKQHLSAYDGLASIHGDGVQVQAFACQGQDVLAVHVTDNRPGTREVTISLRALRPSLVTTRQHTARSQAVQAGGIVVLMQEFHEGAYVCKSAVAIGYAGDAGEIRLSDGQATVASPIAGKATIFISSAASFDPAADVASEALAKLDAARAKTFEQLLSISRQWWSNFWPGTFVQLHSADGRADRMEAYYYYFLYVMASSSRGPLPPKFNGMIFNCRGDARCWGANHWWYNVSTFYDGLPASARWELMEPMFRMYSNMLVACGAAARQQWRSKGLYIPETVAFNGPGVLPEAVAGEFAQFMLGEKPREQLSKELVDYVKFKHPHQSQYNWRAKGDWRENGEFVFGDVGAGPYGPVTHILSAGAKIAYLYWQRYEYTQDRDWLRRRAYPVIKGVAEFYRTFPKFRREADGKFHIHDVNNHESAHGAQDTVEELSAIAGIMPIAARASEILDQDADLRLLWRDIAANLTPFPTTDHPDAIPYRPGLAPNLAQGLKPVAKTLGEHDPVHSLVTVIFYDLCTLESPDDRTRQLADNTFTTLYPGGDAPKPSYDIFWTPLAAACLGRIEDARELTYAQFVQDSEYPNRFNNTEGAPYAPGTTVERLGRASEALQAMLMQSIASSPGGDPVIRVFPAWPRDWDAQFRLLARGAFEVGSSMRNGQIESVAIRSLRGGLCRIRNPWPWQQVDLKRDGGSAPPLSGSLLDIDTKPGEELFLAIKPVPAERKN